MDGRVTIKKNSDFRRMYTRGKSSVSSYLVVYCRKNRLDRNRLGYTVSAKLGKAVCRNRIRQGYDIIIVARKRSVNADYQKMNDAFLRCCDELEILQK